MPKRLVRPAPAAAKTHLPDPIRLAFLAGVAASRGLIDGDRALELIDSLSSSVADPCDALRERVYKRFEAMAERDAAIADLLTSNTETDNWGDI